MSKPSLELHLHTNDTCNLRCHHCYNLSGEQQCAAPQIDTILDTLYYFHDNFDAAIHLEGGEIFLRPDLLRALNELPDDLLRTITVTTNGTIWRDSSDILSMLRRLGALRISVEGCTEEQHQLIRGTPLHPILQNAKSYQNADVPVWLRITLNRHNYWNFMTQTIASLSEEGFCRFQVYEFQHVGRGALYRDEFQLDFPLDELFEDMEEFACSEPDIRFKLMLSARREAEVKAASSQLLKCGYRVAAIPVESGVSIHTDGSVFRCPWDNERQNRLFDWYRQKPNIETLTAMDLTHKCAYCSAFRIGWRC